MATHRGLSIAIIGLTAAGCFGAGELQMPSPSTGDGATAGDPGAGAGAGRAGTAGAAGRGGTGAAGANHPPGSGIALVTNADGWLESNPVGAIGQWWSTGDYFALDGTPGAGPCPAAGFLMAACSTLTTPTPGTPFRPDPAGRGMCTSGTAAQVLAGNDGLLAWSAIWGNIVGVNLATSDPGPLPVIGAYDAPAHGITGFAFEINGSFPPGHLRVTVATAENDRDAAYWEGAAMDVSPFAGPGRYEIRWPEVGGPLYLGADAPPFDATKIESIGFHVVSRDLGPAFYDFCIDKLVLLTN
jgi:hypothetical protein